MNNDCNRLYSLTVCKLIVPGHAQHHSAVTLLYTQDILLHLA
jgi:hypothetical protein